MNALLLQYCHGTDVESLEIQIQIVVTRFSRYMYSNLTSVAFHFYGNSYIVSSNWLCLQPRLGRVLAVLQYYSRIWLSILLCMLHQIETVKSMVLDLE